MIQNAEFALIALHSWEVDGGSSDVNSIIEKVRSHIMCALLFSIHVVFADGRSQVRGRFSVGRRLPPGRAMEQLVAVVEKL